MDLGLGLGRSQVLTSPRMGTIGKIGRFGAIGEICVFGVLDLGLGPGMGQDLASYEFVNLVKLVKLVKFVFVVS